jgi:hypothetical protein
MMMAGIRRNAKRKSPWRPVEKKYLVDLAEKRSKVRRTIRGQWS